MGLPYWRSQSAATNLVFALGVIVSLCYVPGITGAALTTQYAVLSMILPFTLWRQDPVTAFHWLGLVLVTYAVTSLAWNADPLGGVHGFWMLCILALCFWLGSTLTTPRSVYAGLAVGGAMSSLVAVVQVLSYSILPTAPGHPAGIYFSAITQGEILALLVVALLTERMLYWVLPLLPGIALSQSRGAWLALGFGVLGLYVRKTWLLPVAIVMVGISMWIGGASDVERWRIWLAAYGDLTWFGNGVGSFASQMYWDQGKVLYPEFVHNDALQLVYEYGIAAIVPAVIFAFVLLQTQAREWPVVLAFVVMGLFSFPLYMPVTAFIGLLVTGRIVRDWHLVWSFSNNSGPLDAAWPRVLGGKVVSLVSANKGSC